MAEENQEVAPELEATKEDVSIKEPQVDEAKEGDNDTPDPAPQTEPKGAAEPEEPAKPKSRHQRRREQMDRLQSQIEEKDKALAEVNARLQDIEGYSASAAPKEDDFNTIEEFQAALSAHHAMRAMDDRQKAEASKQAEAYRKEKERFEKQKQDEIAQNWASQVSDAKTRYADFEQVALNDSLPISQSIAAMLANMDAGADVAYHLGMNVADAAKISSLPQLEAAIELGKIEARLSIPQPKTVTNAPDPVTPIRSASSVDKDWSKMSPEEYEEWRQSGGIPT